MRDGNHDWKTMFPEPEPNNNSGGDSALFWYIAGALSMLGILAFIAAVGLLV